MDTQRQDDDRLVQFANSYKRRALDAEEALERAKQCVKDKEAEIANCHSHYSRVYARQSRQAKIEVLEQVLAKCEDSVKGENPIIRAGALATMIIIQDELMELKAEKKGGGHDS